jgi:hypothetical protein
LYVEYIVDLYTVCTPTVSVSDICICGSHTSIVYRSIAYTLTATDLLLPSLPALSLEGRQAGSSTTKAARERESERGEKGRLPIRPAIIKPYHIQYLPFML